jgi:hypothetical protein
MMEAVSKWLSPILLGVLLGVAGLALQSWVIGEIDPKAFAVGVAGGSLTMAAIIRLFAGRRSFVGRDKSS